MSELGTLLKQLRGKRSLREIAEITELSHTYISDVENGYRRGSKTPLNPSPDTLKRFSDAYNYPYEELMKKAGYLEKEKELPSLTDKDQRDIGKRMEKLKKDLIEGTNEEDGGLSFMGTPMSEEAIESLLEALEHAERIATLANKKFIPKKHRKE